MRSGLSGNEKPRRCNALFASAPRCPAATSRLNQNWITDEMETNPAGSGALLKMSRHCVRDLLLHVPEVLPLRGDATCATRIIPAGHEPARLLVTLDLKGDFFHALSPLFHTLGPAFRRCGFQARSLLFRRSDPRTRHRQGRSNEGPPWRRSGSAPHPCPDCGRGRSPKRSGSRVPRWARHVRVGPPCLA
jgi:hypothetical protein